MLIVRTVAPDTKGQPVNPEISGKQICMITRSITNTFGLFALFFIAVILKMKGLTTDPWNAHTQLWTGER